MGYFFLAWIAVIVLSLIIDAKEHYRYTKAYAEASKWRSKSAIWIDETINWLAMGVCGMIAAHIIISVVEKLNGK